MFDLWAFLLQTLTASGVATLLLLIKWLFRDKLPPKWHFAVWGVLGIMMLVPAGWNGNYTLVNWLFPIELIKGLVGDYSFTQVVFPVPVVNEMPGTVTEWLFAIYAGGVMVCIVRYVVLYLRLRMALSKGCVASGPIMEQVERVAGQMNVRPCRVIEVQGLPSAFVCGVIHPVLAVPANETLDDKVIMHELFHLKSKDMIWSIVICAFRCLHWCNPLIVYCAGCAANDMEARCDQRVLEQLEGEERREYGMTLLSMVNERFAKTPGTTCVNNGGKRISERIEAIVRFKKYPVGMRLVSICIIVLLTAALILGVPATRIVDPYAEFPAVSYASARSVSCTTPAGAFDTYAKAVLTNNGYYRIMCAPYEMQSELRGEKANNWNAALPDMPALDYGYYIYNLEQLDDDTYEGMIVIELSEYDEFESDEYGTITVAVQNLRVEKENGRWTVTELDDFDCIETLEQELGWGCSDLPGVPYTGVIDDFRINVKAQTVYRTHDSQENGDDFNVYVGSEAPFDLNPKPDAVFTHTVITSTSSMIHLGSQDERDMIDNLGLCLVEMYDGDKRPERTEIVDYYDAVGCDELGHSWGSLQTELGWGPDINLDAGSGSGSNSPEVIEFPEYYIADLYVNKEFAGEVDLYPKEGAAK